MLSTCLIFCRFQPDIAYKSIAYKKTVYFNSNTRKSKLLIQNNDLPWFIPTKGVKIFALNKSYFEWTIQTAAVACKCNTKDSTLSLWTITLWNESHYLTAVFITSFAYLLCVSQSTIFLVGFQLVNISSCCIYALLPKNWSITCNRDRKH